MSRLPTPVLEAIESLDLPAVPSILVAFLKATADESTSIDDLAELVLREPSLAARILTVAQSAAFRGGGGRRSMQQSLQVLGTRLLRSLAACLAVQGAFARLPGARADDLAGFWRHALTVAELARSLAGHRADANAGVADAQEADADEAYLAGLLHDIGELLLLAGLRARYGVLVTGAGSEDALVRAEEATLGTHHGAVGAWLVDQWQLPSLMADAVLFHHHPAAQVLQADALTRTVWAAQATAGLLAGGAAQPADLAADLAAVAAVAGVDGALLERLHTQACAAVATLGEALGVAAAAPTQTLPLWREAPDGPGTAHHGLGVAVLSMAVMQPLQQDLAAAESDAECLLAVRESARILFGVGAVAFLLQHGSPPVLQVAELAGQPAPWRPLRLALDAPGSACAQAARDGQTRSTFDAGRDGALALPDQQLMRGLGCEGLLCVPMHANGRVRGVMVCGVTATQRTRLVHRDALMRSFADLTARTLQSRLALQARDRRLEADLASRYQLRARQVAHEVGNPLGIIKNYLHIMQTTLPPAGGLQNEIEILRQEIDRVALIVRQLDDGAALAARPTERLDLNAVLSGLRLLYAESLFGAAGIGLDLNLQPAGVAAQADRDSVKQIVLNLWKNAVDAAPAGSRVVTSTADHVQHRGGLYAAIRVVDAGPGVPADVLQRLYQPLDPARRPGHAGLGLSIVHGLVHKLGGHLLCHSAPGGGTTFTVLLPQAGPAVP